MAYSVSGVRDVCVVIVVYAAFIVTGVDLVCGAIVVFNAFVAGGVVLVCAVGRVNAVCIECAVFVVIEANT